MVDSDELARESEDVKENVQRKFLVQMPDDFYQFWEFCRSLNSSSPQSKFRRDYEFVGIACSNSYLQEWQFEVHVSHLLLNWTVHV